MVYVVSVVRDFDLYGRLVKNNPCLAGCELCPFDNRIENISITKRYNSFIDEHRFKAEDWLVFCHEDFEFLEPLEQKLASLHLAERALYGIAGVDFTGISRGLTLNSEKDGSKIVVSGFPFSGPVEVSTFDCMSIIVSARTLKREKLRFDENLSFDLYAEELCINARERCNIPSYVLPIKTQHYSWGNIGERFMLQYKYLSNKFSQAQTTYFTTLGRRLGAGHYDETGFTYCRPNRVMGLFLKRMRSDGCIEVALLNYRLCIFRKKIVDPINWKSANPYTLFCQ